MVSRNQTVGGFPVACSMRELARANAGRDWMAILGLLRRSQLSSAARFPSVALVRANTVEVCPVARFRDEGAGTVWTYRGVGGALTSV